MAKPPPRLTVAQFDLLRWIADGCKDGVYEGTSHRVSARSLHNRGLVKVAGKSATWTATATPEGRKTLDVEAKRVETERDRVRKEAEAKAEKERAQLELRERATTMLRRLHDLPLAW
ncbi:hypothetical protein [Tsukamurella tyrosinosolvens]|uniref:hypothetical protein n=1 Tax=Tsukamurella tyrosinosolvens TaxID=57704 RepID=UPI000798E20E|nr:hypothetical protein [Tsukamurella tyrosinosolvens]KXP08409.1 hypothetical protein AXK59_23700 [Tsukamurella tyrosinosolvens]